MKRIYAALFLLIQIAAVQFAECQTPVQLLKQHSIDWMKALERKDISALEKFMAPEYTLGAVGDQKKVDRATWLKNATERDWTDTKYHFIDVRMRSNTHAIVNSKMSFKVNPIPFTITSNIIDYWVYREGRWQVTDRLLGADTITNFINTAKGFLIGIALTFLIVWLLMVSRRRRANRKAVKPTETSERN